MARLLRDLCAAGIGLAPLLIGVGHLGMVAVGFVLEAPMNHTVTDRMSVRLEASGLGRGEQLCIWARKREVPMPA